jgi:L-fucose isomerase-like protein
MEEYLGMRVESVDEVEIIRRMTGAYLRQEAEYEKALEVDEGTLQGRLGQESRHPSGRPRTSRRKRTGNSPSR